MQPFQRPIGSSTVSPLQTTRAGMTVSASPVARPVDPPEPRTSFQIETHPDGTILWQSSEPTGRVFLVKSGRVRLMRGPRKGARAMTALLKAGDLFGEQRPEATSTEELAVASGDVEVWGLDSYDYRAQLEGNPALAMELFRAYAERVRALSQRVHTLTFKEVPARLADTLLALGQGHGEKCPHGGEIDLRGVTQQDLADLVGASRSFVSTLVNEMKRDGILGNVGRTLCIRDLSALRKLAAQEK
jgi:CRP/FNR family cyclic AMP-dependent transcriptional regulator